MPAWMGFEALWNWNRIFVPCHRPLMSSVASEVIVIVCEFPATCEGGDQTRMRRDFHVPSASSSASSAFPSPQRVRAYCPVPADSFRFVPASEEK